MAIKRLMWHMLSGSVDWSYDFNIHPLEVNVLLTIHNSSHRSFTMISKECIDEEDNSLHKWKELSS